MSNNKENSIDKNVESHPSEKLISFEKFNYQATISKSFLKFYKVGSFDFNYNKKWYSSCVKEFGEEDTISEINEEVFRVVTMIKNEIHELFQKHKSSSLFPAELFAYKKYLDSIKYDKIGKNKIDKLLVRILESNIAILSNHIEGTIAKLKIYSPSEKINSQPENEEMADSVKSQGTLNSATKEKIEKILSHLTDNSTGIMSISIKEYQRLIEYVEVLYRTNKQPDKIIPMNPIDVSVKSLIFSFSLIHKDIFVSDTINRDRLAFLIKNVFPDRMNNRDEGKIAGQFSDGKPEKYPR